MLDDGWSTVQPSSLGATPCEDKVTLRERAARSMHEYGRRASAQLLADRLIRAAYRGLLGRSPDDAGLAYWRGRLRAGMSWAGLLADLARSDEFTGAVDRVTPFLSRLDGEIVLTSELPDGSRICAGGPCSERSFVAPLVAARGIWEPALTRLIFAMLRAGDGFVDGGANLGWFSIVAARATTPGGRVVAFEPGAEARDLCAVNLARNGVEVDVRSEALWHSTERRAFSVVSEGLAYAYVAEQAESEESIQCVALDDLVDSHEIEVGRLSVVKLDIEGAEPHALAGMRRTLQRHWPTVMVEVNSHCLRRLGNAVGDIWDGLDDMGYQVEVLAEPHQARVFADLPSRSVAEGVLALHAPRSKTDFVDRIAEADSEAAAPSDVVQVVASPRTM